MDSVNHILKYTFIVFIIFLSKCSPGLLVEEIDNGGLNLPEGFEVVVVVDSIGPARHIAVNDNGDIYVKLTKTLEWGKGNVALRDVDGDGRADSIVYFGDYADRNAYGSTGMRIYNDYIYFSTGGEIYRNKLTPRDLIPKSEIEIVLRDDYENDIHGYEHIAKPMTFDNEGYMYVPFGAPSDVCRVDTRVPGSLGMDPCPELEEHGGIWKFEADKLNQTQKDGERYVTGLRSILAFDWNNKDNSLYAVQHGRDGFRNSWPDLYSEWDDAMLPAEEFFRLEPGDDAGWPYYYYDQIKEKKILMPEYGGDGEMEGEGADYLQPLIGFPGHFAPMDLLFYTGDQFPERYKNGAFIAFHGSNIRSPYPMAGNMVCFVPFKDGQPSLQWEVFADGFAGKDTVLSSSEADFRPMGLAMGPDGSLYVGDSERGRIWKIMFRGNKKKFGSDQLAEMEKRKLTMNVKTPDPAEDNFRKEVPVVGEKLYNLHCASCHQKDGKGDGLRFPPIEKSDWVYGDKEVLIDVVLNGLIGPIKVNNEDYSGTMPSFSSLNNGQIAQILTYIRQNFENNSSAVRPSEIERRRK